MKSFQMVDVVVAVAAAGGDASVVALVVHFPVDVAQIATLCQCLPGELLIGVERSAYKHIITVPARYLARFFFIFIIALRIGAETITTV